MTEPRNLPQAEFKYSRRLLGLSKTPKCISRPLCKALVTWRVSYCLQLRIPVCDEREGDRSLWGVEFGYQKAPAISCHVIGGNVRRSVVGCAEECTRGAKRYRISLFVDALGQNAVLRKIEQLLTITSPPRQCAALCRYPVSARSVGEMGDINLTLSGLDRNIGNPLTVGERM